MIAIWGGGFMQPNPWDYLFGQGIGTNLGASVIWVFVAGAVTAFVYPPLKGWFVREIGVLRAHAEHQTRVIEDHYERAVGERHPLHGALEHLRGER